MGQEKKNCVKMKDSLTGKLVYKFPEKFPQPDMGGENFNTFLSRNMKIASNEYENGIFDETLVAVFVVSTDGQIIGERIISESISKRLETEFLELIKNEKWKSGFCGNEPVDSLIEFSLKIYSKKSP